MELPSLSLAGIRVFLVEDEALILFTLQDMLEELGCQVADSALRIDDALAKAADVACDVAILDVNVAGERIDPVAERLAARGVPLVFATGYGRASLPASLSAQVLLPKPYRPCDVEAAVGAALRTASTAGR
jgi:DNA-binding response OmpR family regulator